jgi:hypothetical protein
MTPAEMRCAVRLLINTTIWFGGYTLGAALALFISTLIHNKEGCDVFLVLLNSGAAVAGLLLFCSINMVLLLRLESALS